MLSNSLNLFQSFESLLMRLFSSITHLLIGLFCFFLMSSILSSIHILKISALSDVGLENIFYHLFWWELKPVLQTIHYTHTHTHTKQTKISKAILAYTLWIGINSQPVQENFPLLKLKHTNVWNIERDKGLF